jgi:hypothetical protein
LTVTAVPVADPDLPHQVVLHLGTNNRVVVSCNCLRRSNVAGGPSYVLIGESRDYEETRRLYNDPRAHAEPFDPAVDALKPWWIRWGSYQAGRHGEMRAAPQPPLR